MAILSFQTFFYCKNMLVSAIYDEIRFESNTNSTKVSDASILIGVNLDYGELVMLALRSRGDFNFQINEATSDLISTSGLTAGQNGYNGEYAWPSDLVKPTRMEVSFDGTNFNKARVYDITDELSRSEFTQSDLNNTFSQNEPHVRFERNSFFIRPLKATTGNITGGIHIWYEQRQTALTASDTPVIEPNYHRLFVLMGVLRVMRKFRGEYTVNDRMEIKNEIALLKADMANFYSRQVEEGINLQPKYISYS